MTAPAIDAVAVIRQRTVPLIEELLPTIEPLSWALRKCLELEAAVWAITEDDDDEGRDELLHVTGVEALKGLLCHVGAMVEKGFDASGFGLLDAYDHTRDAVLKALDLPEGLLK